LFGAVLAAKDLGLLCKSAWQALREMFQEVASDPSALVVANNSVRIEVVALTGFGC
jgi:hypothetical protein